MHFVVIFGPPAVGKMTVGRELCNITEYKLFHNHMTVEPIKDIFEFGSLAFVRLVTEFRRRVIEEALATGLDGLVTTFVWALELPEDTAIIESWMELVESGGGTSHLVELYADRATRLHRNGTELRQAEKRSHRDPAVSEAIFHRLDHTHVMNTGSGPTLADAVLGRADYFRLDNSALTAHAAARIIADRFALPT